MSHGGLGLQPSTSSSALFTAPSSSRVRRASSKLKLSAESGDMSDDEDYDRAGGGGGKAKSKSRRELPAGAVATLKAWLLSPEHFTHPYPTPQDQVMLMQKTGIDKKQLKNWFTNARRRIWKPMLKKQLEAGKLAAAGGGMAIQATAVQAASAQASQQQAAPPREEMYQNYQQAAQNEEDPAQEQRYQQPQVQYQQQPQQTQVVQVRKKKSFKMGTGYCTPRAEALRSKTSHDFRHCCGKSPITVFNPPSCRPCTTSTATRSSSSLTGRMRPPSPSSSNNRCRRRPISSSAVKPPRNSRLRANSSRTFP